MGFFDRFKRKTADEEPGLDPLHDLVPENLQPGWLVDHGMTTWTVKARNRYDFDGDRVEEWQLEHGRRRRFLEHEDDDGPVWTLAKKIPVGTIDEDVVGHVGEHEDPPRRITFEGETYYLDGAYAGYFYAGGEGEGRPLIKWEYVDDEESRFVTLEQWGETDFEASAGRVIEPYELTNILPGEES